MGQVQISLFLLILCIYSAPMGFGFPCKEVEINALLNFKRSFIDESNLLRSWVGQDCCNWKGVGCENFTSNVIKLDLGSFSLFSGEVSSSLLELKQLRYLDLSNIDFNGSRIPEFLGSMRQLQYLDLSESRLSGQVPQNLDNLTKLVVLDLSWIDLSQEVDSLKILLHAPSLLTLKLTNCQLRNPHQPIKNIPSSLQHLDLSENFLSGSFPSFIQNLSSIVFLGLSYNNFSSSLPSWITSKKNLKHLDLAHNSFRGPFPQFTQNSTSLTFIDLSYNQFSSSIPSWLGSRRELEHLDLSYNQFNRVDGGILNFIASLCSLLYLDLSNNPLQEKMSESQSNFPRCTKYHMEYLDLRNNSINIHLPIMQSFSSLRFLDLSHNYIEILPLSLGTLSSLEYLDLSFNHLSVVHQVSLANLSSLDYLDISSNSVVFDVSPDWIPPFQLTSLNMLPCKFNGSFPKWILSQEKITTLDLSDTSILGPLPNKFGNRMSSLEILRLANNHINGSIPVSLCELGWLSILDLQNNWLSGSIPDCWANSGIVDVQLRSNRLSGPIPKSLVEVPTLQLLSLSNNSLEGDLSLVALNSENLMVLDVGKNNLHGEVPLWNRANFPSLQILILRENRFKGRIPPQLCLIHTLQIIDLAKII